MREVSGIPRLVDEAQARAIASLVMDGGIPQNAREVHYPYYWYRLRATAGTLLGESTIDLSCLVDGRTGLLATSDLLTVCRRIVPQDDVLGSIVGEPEAEEAVRRYLPHVLLTGRRWLHHRNVDLRNGLLVHKPFWVMGGAAETILVDGVTGLVHPLDVRTEIVHGITVLVPSGTSGDYPSTSANSRTAAAVGAGAPSGAIGPSLTRQSVT